MVLLDGGRALVSKMAVLLSACRVGSWQAAGTEEEDQAHHVGSKQRSYTHIYLYQFHRIVLKRHHFIFLKAAVQLCGLSPEAEFMNVQFL